MGLIETAEGMFYIQKSLRTGEIIKILPVKRPEMPSHLPSIVEMGINNRLIQRHRAHRKKNLDNQRRALSKAGGGKLLKIAQSRLASLARTGLPPVREHEACPSLPAVGDADQYPPMRTIVHDEWPKPPPVHMEPLPSISKLPATWHDALYGEDEPYGVHWSLFPEVGHRPDTVNLPTFGDFEDARRLSHRTART